MNAIFQQTILILEDEPLIAMDLEFMLEKAGYETKVCTTCADAKHWLEAETPAVALLDIRLKDGTCTDVASILNARGVPLIVCSGTAKLDAHEIFSKGTWLQKPTDDAAVVRAVEEALQIQQFEGMVEREA